MPDFLAGELWKPENRKYHLYLKTATNVGVPPSLLMEKGKRTPTWTEKDKRLMLAWQALQDETCPRCGVPFWLGHTENKEHYVEFEVKESECYSCQALEKAQDDPKKNRKKGVTPYVVPVPLEGGRLPTRAEGYSKSS